MGLVWNFSFLSHFYRLFPYAYEILNKNTKPKLTYLNLLAKLQNLHLSKQVQELLKRI